MDHDIYENSLGMRFVLIPPGVFAMGATAVQVEDNIRHGWAFAQATGEPFDPAWARRQEPVHEVRIKNSFYLGQAPVTNAQFRQFRLQHDCGAYDGYTLNDDLQPVVYVSWHDACAFTRWLSEREGATYRLPHETEWEYAARAGCQEIWPWGDDIAETARYANVACLSKKALWPDLYGFPVTTGHAVTSPVGSFLPNSWELFDVIGNVWEWTLDSLADYESGLPGDKAYRVNRGGGWSNCPRACRVAYRSIDPPELVDHDIGFRVLLEING